MCPDDGRSHRIFVYGIGNFGFAILRHLERKPQFNGRIHAFDHDLDVLESLALTGRHPFFHPGTEIGRGVSFEPGVDRVADCDVLVMAVPSAATREVLSAVKATVHRALMVVNTAKALDYHTGGRLSAVAEAALGWRMAGYGLLAGGTIAQDLLRGEPLGASLACENPEVLAALTDIFESKSLFIYPTADLIGVEYASAFKNVVAILAGIAEGVGLSYGAETHVISRVAYEVEELVVREFGGQRAAFSIGSQCWGNDLWMSCTGRTRNREFGVLLGRGIPWEEASVRMTRAKKTVEGLSTLAALEPVAALRAYPRLAALVAFKRSQIDLCRLKEALFVNGVTDVS